MDRFVQRFTNNFSVGLTMRYNHVFAGDRGIPATSNAPLFLGAQAGWHDWSISFSIAQPYTYKRTPDKALAFDMQFTFYQDAFMEQLAFREYDDFLAGGNGDSRSARPVDLDLASISFFAAYVFNHETFSLRAAYPMTRLQEKSAGSWIAGGDLRVSTVQSTYLKAYEERKYFVSYGPGVGYSWTFVSASHVFFNVFLVVGMDMSVEYRQGYALCSPLIAPKFAFGKHNKTWSFNVAAENEIFFFLGAPHIEDYFTFNSVTLTVIKRFF
jgi:hypothetical protein